MPLNKSEIEWLLNGHRKSKQGRDRLTKDDPEVNTWFVKNETGLCLCGCGQKTEIAKYSERKLGYLKGYHKKWIIGHRNFGINGRGKIEDGKQWCPACKKNLSPDVFYVSKSGTKSCYCVDCYPKVRARTSHGLSMEDYDQLLLQQNQSCAICKRKQKLYIDHDHETGEVRGLVCNRCNVGLHLIDSEFLFKALEYVYGSEFAGYKFDAKPVMIDSWTEGS